MRIRSLWLTTSRSLLSCLLATVLVAQTVFGVSASSAAPIEKSNPKIRVNSIGFFPDGIKRATLAGECESFSVVEASTGTTVFTGRPGLAINTGLSDTDEMVRIADFSAFSTPGRYWLEVKGLGRSAPFSISSAVWDQPFYAVSRAFYLWRCGCAVQSDWAGQTFQHGPCHLDDGWLDQVGKGHTRRPGTGGWHDAGDYNKYVVNAGVTVGLLLQTWEQFGPSLAKVNLHLPGEETKIPDLLREIRWELEWLLTMQQSDGRVYHKLSDLNFGYWGKPEADRSVRFYSPWSSTATADFVAMLAAAARCFRSYDASFSDQCLEAARRSAAFLLSHPENVEADLHAFQTGAYQAPDVTHRLWAAAEMWETTGETVFLHDFEQRAKEVEFNEVGPTWGDVRDLALGTYLRSRRTESRNSILVARLESNLLSLAARIVETAESNGHGRPLGSDAKSWFWGCNGSVAGQTYLLHLAYHLKANPRYRQAALHALAFLFGRNYHARSYVTGLGVNPPLHPHDRRGEPAWPGYLVGGGWPNGKSWVDKAENFQVNEIAINWNASLVYALAPFVSGEQAR